MADQSGESAEARSLIDDSIRVVRVRLPVQSLKTQRVLHDGHEDLYPVILGLSRPVDEFERRELTDFQIQPSDDDTMWVMIPDTTLEYVRDHLDDLHETFASASSRAQVVREASEAEDERLAQLVQEVSRKTNQEFAAWDVARKGR